MYIVSIKEGTAPRRNTETNNLIDQLFGVTVEEINYDTNKFYKTITTVADYYDFDYNRYYNHLMQDDTILDNFLGTHDVSTMYTQFQIPKHSGGMRTIDAPNDELKTFMREFSNKVLKHYKLLCHNSAFAYIKKRSVIDAVKEHQANDSNWFLKLDLKDFFGSCSKEFIVRQLSNIHPFASAIEHEHAYNGNTTINFLNKLADLSCLDNKLPQGTPISPWLTNLIMIEFDYKITKMLNSIYKQGLIKQRYVYTRYADDILISAKQKFEYEIIVNKIKEILTGTPLTIKDTKTRFGSSSGRNWNLGIMYNKDNKLTVGHKKKRMIKDNIYYFIKYGDNFDLAQCQWLQGNISWIQAVEPDYIEGLLQYYKNKFNIDVIKNLKLKIKTLNS